MKPQRDPFDETHRFTATLFHTGGKGGWTFAPLPKDLKLPVTGSWGMTPVIAAVDGKPWKTTVWRDEKSKSSFLPVPKKIRGSKGAGDTVNVELRMDRERILGHIHPLE
jgi:hypothetical protein